MAIQWMMPNDFAGGMVGGEYINETSSGGLEFLTPGGSYINEQAGGVTPFTPPNVTAARTLRSMGYGR